MLPTALRIDSSTKHCGKRLPQSATSISTIPGGNGQHFPSLKVVLASPRQYVPLPACASPLSATRQLVGQIHQDVFESYPTSDVDSVAKRWTDLGHELITTDKKPFQRYWSSAVHKALIRNLKADALPSRLARISTAAQGHSGDRITAYPIAQVGTRLHDETLRVSFAP